MAKRRGKGTGRGRRGAKIDPATGRFVAGPAGSGGSSPIGVAPPSPQPATPTGPTVTPQQIMEEVSGFRKALTETMEGLEGRKSQLQDALLDGLRKTAEELVQQNEDIFGTRYEKTVDQSAAYEIFEGVVQLGEAAAKARTVEQKRSILRRLRTYKKVAQNVFKGGGKQGEIAQQLLQMIEKIEAPLAKEAGMRAAAKEKITDFMKTLPEKMAAKIPLVGGIISRSLQRRREGKEEEAAALANLTEEISRAGRTSLYGRGGAGGMGRGRAGGSMEPPVEGATTLADMDTGAGGAGFNQEAVVTLRSILANVIDIRKMLYDQYDPAQEELKTEEQKRESENRLNRLFSKFKFGGAGGKGTTGGGFFKSLSDALGFDKAIKEVVSDAIVPAISTALGSGVGSLIARMLPSTLVPAIGAAIVTGMGLLVQAIVAAIGLGIGTMLAYGAWKYIIDPLFSSPGEKLGVEAFSDGSAFGADIPRDYRHAQGMRESASKSFRDAVLTAKQTGKDPRQLPRLVQEGLLQKHEAFELLESHEKKFGKTKETEMIRKKIALADVYLRANSTKFDGTPLLTEEQKNAEIKIIEESFPSISAGDTKPFTSVVTPSRGNETQVMQNNLEKSRAALEAEQMGPPAPTQSTTVVAPTTNTSNTTNNFNTPSGSTRNNDPTLKAAEKGSM